MAGSTSTYRKMPTPRTPKSSSSSSSSSLESSPEGSVPLMDQKKTTTTTETTTTLLYHDVNNNTNDNSRQRNTNNNNNNNNNKKKKMMNESSTSSNSLYNNNNNNNSSSSSSNMNNGSSNHSHNHNTRRRSKTIDADNGNDEIEQQLPQHKIEVDRYNSPPSTLTSNGMAMLNGTQYMNGNTYHHRNRSSTLTNSTATTAVSKVNGKRNGKKTSSNSTMEVEHKFGSKKKKSDVAAHEQSTMGYYLSILSAKLGTTLPLRIWNWIIHSFNIKNLNTHENSIYTYLAFAFLAFISWYCFPTPFNHEDSNSLGDNDRHKDALKEYVFYCGWITALATGLGVLPFIFVREMKSFWLGISNATAAGMMLAASTSLLYEGATLEGGPTFEDDGSQGSSNLLYTLSPLYRAILGMCSGLIFIFFSQKILDKYEDLKVAGLDGMEAKKVLLLIFVMTLHSFTEGVGIGVSFGGENTDLGNFISLSLAVHNVPEGLAVALVLIPKKISLLNTALWCIFTSIPQPLMAVPAFQFVEHFRPVLPIGLGFAAGAMLWVAIFELAVEAIEDTNKITTCTVMGAAFITMMLIQSGIK